VAKYMLCISVDGVTINPDQIYDRDNSYYIPRGHYLWDVYEEWLAEGNEPDPYEPVIYPRSE